MPGAAWLGVINLRSAWHFCLSRTLLLHGDDMGSVGPVFRLCHILGILSLNLNRAPAVLIMVLVWPPEAELRMVLKANGKWHEGR